MSADNVLSTIAIVNGLRKRGGGIYIYLSSTNILLGYEMQYTLNRVYILIIRKGFRSLLLY
jgi:hypothetical protein